MFRVPIDGAASVVCDNQVGYQNTVLPESTLNKKYHLIAYHCCREEVAFKTIQVANDGTLNNLANLFTKMLTCARRSCLLGKFKY